MKLYLRFSVSENGSRLQCTFNLEALHYDHHMHALISAVSIHYYTQMPIQVIMSGERSCQDREVVRREELSG